MERERKGRWDSGIDLAQIKHIILDETNLLKTMSNQSLPTTANARERERERRALEG